MSYICCIFIVCTSWKPHNARIIAPRATQAAALSSHPNTGVHTGRVAHLACLLTLCVPSFNFSSLHKSILSRDMSLGWLWHPCTFSREAMRVDLLNINAVPDAQLVAGIYLNLLQQVWAQQVLPAFQEKLSTSGSFEGVKGLYLRWTETGPICPRGGGNGGKGWRKGEMVVSPLASGERWMGCGGAPGQTLPTACLPHPVLLPRANGECSRLQLSQRAGVCVGAWAVEVDLCGLNISSRESPPTNFPPGAPGHCSPSSLLPWDPHAAPKPPATSFVLTVMRTPRWGGEEESRHASPSSKTLHTHTHTLSPSLS